MDSEIVNLVNDLYFDANLEGTLVKQSFIGHCGWISSVFWNKVRENLFISASFDKTVKMWDVR